MLNTRLAFLFRRHTVKKTSATEKEELFLLMADRANEKQVKELFGDAWEAFQPNTPVFTKAQSEEIFNNVLESDSGQDVLPAAITVKRIRWYRIAAAILIFTSLSSYYFLNTRKQGQLQIAEKQSYQNEIVPGGNKAILTLANGSRIVLDSVQNGLLAKQGNVEINKSRDGQLVFNASVKSDSLGEFLVGAKNTISTPRGGQYQVILPDGSNVWLNASSSISFPTAFVGKERNVNITGEAYFEVAKNAQMPFIVDANGTKVQVLGTHFNVMAYKEEADVRTTLLEGSVKLTKGETSALLKPGEQGSISQNGNMFKVAKADIKTAIAWKDGYFMFDNANLSEVMRSISRWYDVDVVYEDGGQLSDHEFVGQIERNSNLSKVLKILELGGVHFKVEGKKLIVKP